MQVKACAGNIIDEDGNGVCALSVVVPFHNAKDHFAETLESIASQDFDDFEVVLVDDGSADGSAEIAKGYASRDGRFSYVRQNNQGAGVARNLGLDMAKGEYVTFLDSDDLFEPDFLSTMYEMAWKMCSDIVMCRAEAFESKTGSVLGAFGPKKRVPEGLYEPGDYSRNLMQEFTSVAWDKLFRTQFIREHGLRFQKLVCSNDNYFVISALAEARLVYVVDQTLVHYRIGTGHSLRDNMVTVPYCDLLAFDAIFDRLSSSDPNRAEKLESFREWAIGMAYATARDLVVRDAGSAQLFRDRYFREYADKWGVDSIGYRDVTSWASLWRYRRFRGSSIEGFAWACRAGANGRAAVYRKTGFQRVLFAADGP